MEVNQLQDAPSPGAPAPDAAPRDAPPHLTPRGRRTRRALVEAARRVFSSSGFVDGSIVAITQEAQVSNATFYTYFRSKEQVFLDVAAELVQEIATTAEGLAQGLPLDVSIARSNAFFLDKYAAHGRMLRVVAEAANHNEAIRIAWRDIRRATVEEAARHYTQLQASGQVSPSLNPALLANVLGGATEQAAYVLTFLDPEIDRAELERTLNRVWLSALTSDAGGAETL